MRFLDNSNFLIYKLSDLSEKICSGKDKIVENNNGEYPIYGSTGCIGYSPNYSYKGKKILVARVGAHAGYCYLVNGHYSVTDNTLIISPLNSDLFEYLFYCIVSKQLHKLSFGSGQPLVTGSQLSSLKVSIPQNNEEMNRVANLMKLLDERIDTQNKIIEEKNTLFRSLCQTMFLNKEMNHMLRDICTINKGQQINNEFLLEKGEFAFINGGITASGYFDKFNRAANTITISEGGNSCGFVNFNHEPIWAGGHCYSMDNISISVNKDYLFYYLKYKEKEIMKLRVGTGLPNIQKSDLLNFRIYLPSIEEQNKIATIFNSLFESMNYNNLLLEKYKLQKEYLLKNLFI